MILEKSCPCFDFKIKLLPSFPHLPSSNTTQTDLKRFSATFLLDVNPMNYVCIAPCDCSMMEYVWN
jgi:hypothetical protein